jgi:hypothetical protein
MKKFVATVVFSGFSDPEPDRAAAELQEAGYTVVRLPDELRPFLDEPDDDFIEVHFECADDDQAKHTIDNIIVTAAKYGGDRDDYSGAMAPDHVPFAWFERETDSCPPAGASRDEE